MNAIPEDLKQWRAIACPTRGLRFDARTLELLDTNADGCIRTDEVLAALTFLEKRGVTVADLATPDEKAKGELEATLAKRADLTKLAPTDAEKAALAAWEARGRAPEVAVCGADTAKADAALAAVEPVIDAFFTPPDDMPLVSETPDVTLPLDGRINPRHQEAIFAFRDLCLKPLGVTGAVLTRQDFRRVRAAFAPYRAWVAAKPVLNADALVRLEEEERFCRYRLHLGAFLENFITMARLYDGTGAIFQTGVLRLDGREMHLCFHVANEAEHAALVGKSKCCVLYLRLVRADAGETRTICAVVTAGHVGGLYVGRNGVFYDRDGKNWSATVTKVVEAQVSLSEAFWAPWRKVGETVAATVGKFLGDRQSAALLGLAKGTSESAQATGAALASSVAAVGIGVGMVGAAAASVMAVVSSMSPLKFAVAVCATVLAVSLPSVIMTWFKLRRRDLGAILNASGWAINGEMRFSMRQARAFTVCGRRIRLPKTNRR